MLSRAPPTKDFRTENKIENTEVLSMKDELQAQFTVWIEKVIHSARIDYLRRLQKEPKSISFESIDVDNQLSYVQPVNLRAVDIENGEYAFENEKIEMAFLTLSKTARRVLLLWVVCDMMPEDIAAELGCSVQNIYKVRARAIEKLKELLKNGNE